MDNNRPLDFVDAYLKEIGQNPTLTAEQQKELAKRVEKGDKKAKDEMIRANLKLVVWYAKRYIGRSSDLPLMDLIQEGNMGLIKAVERFDWRKGYKFSTYAIWWISHSITRALANEGRTIRVPVNKIESIYKYVRVRDWLVQNLNREPLVEEIAAEMGIDNDQAYKIDSIYRQKVVSLGFPVGTDDERQNKFLSDFIEDESEDAPFLNASRNILRTKLKKIMKDLASREKKIIYMRFGLQDGVTHTLQEVGDVFGVSRERIRQIQDKVLDKIRKHEETEKLKEY